MVLALLKNCAGPQCEEDRALRTPVTVGDHGPEAHTLTSQVMKVKLVGAKKGHSLLKKKADALTMRLRGLLHNILQAKDDMGQSFRDGNFAMAEVKYAAGDIKPTVIESVGTAQKRVEIRIDNIAGRPTPPPLAFVLSLTPLPLHSLLPPLRLVAPSTGTRRCTLTHAHAHTHSHTHSHT